MDLPPICDDWEFCELDGLIFCVIPAQARNERQQLLEIDPDYRTWHLEGVINHVHFDGQDTRDDLRYSVREAEVLAQALHRTYPDRRFVIVNRLGGDTLSFSQALPGAPTIDFEPREPHPEETYCRHCKARRAHHLRPEPDPEFPELEWAECAVCGREQWLASRSRFTLVEPDTV